jgi:hypothetical protein
MSSSGLGGGVNRIVPLASAVANGVPDLRISLSAAWRNIPRIGSAASLYEDVYLSPAIAGHAVKSGGILIVVTRRAARCILTAGTLVLTVGCNRRQK